MTKKKRRRLWLLAALAAVVVSALYHGTLDPETWQVSSERLPAAFDGLRVTLLTDLHGASFGPDHQLLLQAVADQRPDLIAISGDLADERTAWETLPALLTGLAEIAPTYYVTGNHEWVREDTEDLLRAIADCGVTVLRNDYLLLERDGQTIVLAGAEDPNAYRDMETPEALVSRIRAEVPGDPYILMLYHRNNSLSLWSQLEVDLVLAGHGHGGVIRLPWVGGLLGVDRRLFPRDCEGLYQAGRTTLAVSRGLGGIRLFNRPHLPTLELHRSNP